MRIHFRILWVIFYALLVALMITLLNTWGRNRIYNSIHDDKVKSLYSEATVIADEYITNLESSSINDSTPLLRSEFKTIYTVSGTMIWLVRSNGRILIDSDDGRLEGENIYDYSSSFLQNQTYEGNDLNKLIKGDYLYIIYPLAINQRVTGYIVLNTNLKDLNANATNYTDKIIICFIIFSVVLALVMIFLYFNSQLSLYKVTNAAKEYALGHFDYDIGKRPRNDFAEIYDSIDYMGRKFGNYADQQKKFIANVSHDFRSPLTSIHGYTEAMIDGTIPPEMHEKYLRIILFETNRLKKMTDNLLELNNFEHDGVKIERSKFDLNSIIRMTAASFEDRCSKKNILIELTFSSKELVVNADIYKIEQVIQNLIDNAIKFSNTNSKIHVTTSSQRNKAFVSVKDTGIGIPKEAQAKVWNRFYKTDISRGKDKTGSGLGLSIVKEIIEAHGENINVISTPGAGTEFIFSLKLASDQK